MKKQLGGTENYPRSPAKIHNRRNTFGIFEKVLHVASGQIDDKFEIFIAFYDFAAH